MENWQMVMEKSWKNILSSLWEPWKSHRNNFFFAIIFVVLPNMKRDEEENAQISEISRGQLGS